jgi:hypothetical protein
MTFAVAQRIRGAGKLRGRSMLRAGRLLTNRLCAMRIPTPEERANVYVSRMPIAVLLAAEGTESPGSVGNRR